MPVVLVEVPGVARSGHEYGDQTGVAYEYPGGRYERLIWPGQPFIYQVPKVGYTGAGIIGAVEPSIEPGRLICELVSVEYFAAPVPLKDEAGNYYEADVQYWRDKVYWGQGVRPLSLDRMEAITRRGYLRTDQAHGSLDIEYADYTDTRAVERYSVDAVIAYLRGRHPNLPLHEMPHNNPGFDLAIGPAERPYCYVEVKGTRASSPDFFISEGERRFSAAHDSRYYLIVVSGINLVENTHAELLVHEGDIMRGTVIMRPHQWRGRLSPTNNAEVQLYARLAEVMEEKELG